MPDKKLTDNEIVKALECCGKLHIENIDSFCNECIFKGKAMCIGYLCDNSIDLINRLQEENERLQKSYLRNQEIFAEQSLENERLKAEIERLKEKNECYAELEQGCYVSGYKKIKAEAIKEFAERLKEKSDSRFDYSELVFEISEEDIDNLVKEMAGEDNAKEKE